MFFGIYLSFFLSYYPMFDDWDKPDSSRSSEKSEENQIQYFPHCRCKSVKVNMEQGVVNLGLISKKVKEKKCCL